MTSRDRPTVLISLNNHMTIGALNAFNRLGLVVPEDVSLLGFDKFDLAEHLTPKLTLFEHDDVISEMGACAADLVMNAIESGTTLTTTASRIFQSELAKRESVARIPT